jgi:hypothetical protein
LNRAASSSGGSTSNVLLARLGQIPGFSSGSASPLQRDLSSESQATQTQSSTIQYSALTLTFSEPQMTNAGLGVIDSGGNGVVMGGGSQGSMTGGAVPLARVPSPSAASLALIGIAGMACLRRRVF